MTYSIVPSGSRPDIPHDLMILRELKGSRPSLQKVSENLLHLHHTISKLNPTSVRFLIPTWHAYFNQMHELKWRKQYPNMRPSMPYIPRDQCALSDNILVVERVRLFSINVRCKLLDLCFPGARTDDRVAAAKSYKYWDLPILPYLGKRQKGWPYPSHNYILVEESPLHINQMEVIGLDVQLYSRIMGEALAIIYWKAKWDAHRIKFILSPVRQKSKGIESKILGNHAIWLTHLTECRPMAMTRRGVEHAVWAFLINAPYCPRPGREDANDKRNWLIFRGAFLCLSRRLLEMRDLWLADLWIEKVEAWGSNTLPE